MIIGVLKIILHFPYIHSLKGKRQRLNSLKQNLKQRYNISISEIEYKEYWQKSLLGISMISDSQVLIEKIFNKILDYFNFFHEGYIVEYNAEYMTSEIYPAYEKI